MKVTATAAVRPTRLRRACPQEKEVLWHLLQVTPRIKWSSVQLEKVHLPIERAHRDASSIVKACALQAEVELLPQSPMRCAKVARLVRRSLASSVPSLRARARRLTTLLEKLGFNDRVRLA